jgi:biopolymer transport protein TolR
MAMQTTGGPLRAEMNVTPMIDVLLVLLVVFILIQPIQKYGYRAEVPSEEKPGGSPENAVVLEIITSDTPDTVTLRINKRVVSQQELASQVGAIYKFRGEKVLFILGEDALEFRKLAEIIDIVKTAEPTLRVGLMAPRT